MAFTPFGSDCVSTRVAGRASTRTLVEPVRSGSQTDPPPRESKRWPCVEARADAWDGDAALRDLRCPTCGREAVREDGWAFWLRVRVAAHDEGA